MGISSAGLEQDTKAPLRALYKNPLRALYKKPLRALYKKPLRALTLLVICSTFVMPASVLAEDISVATAANFRSTLIKLIEVFHADSETEVKIITASSGVLYNQINHGAPFDVFLSADSFRPKKLALSRSTDTFIYAIGRLVFWMPQGDEVNKPAFLEFDARLAIANPHIAPYGSAAMQVLNQLKPDFSNLVRGQNVNQAYQYVDSGNAAAGLLSLSQLTDREEDNYWLVPEGLYSAIEQHGILLNHQNSGAESFVNFIQSPEAHRIITGSGYGLPAPSRTKVIKNE